MDLMSSVPVLMIIGAVAIPLVVYLVLGLGEKILGRISVRSSALFRPWFWLGIPLLIVIVVLGYPLLRTIVLSFQGDESAFSLENFQWLFAGDLLGTLGNTAIWIVVVPLATVVLSVIVGVLFERVKYERLAMTLILLPTAISFSAASVVWRQLYSYQPAGKQQLGLLNALWTLIPGNQPVPWLQTPLVNTFCLIFVAIWATLGISALIISSAIKNVPEDIIEAASLDGAAPFRIFASITLPTIMPAVLVVITTTLISALKTFDIVYVMTNGNFGTDILANLMYKETFSSASVGHASAIAIVLLVVALPIVLINIRQFRSEKQR